MIALSKPIITLHRCYVWRCSTCGERNAGRQKILLLTRGLMGLWIFHHLLGVFEHPPSISAPDNFEIISVIFWLRSKLRSPGVKIPKFFKNGFWTIKSFIFRIEQRVWYHRVCLVKARRTMYNLTLKGQSQNLASGQVRARSLGDSSRSNYTSFDSTPIPRLYLIWISSYWQKTVGDLEWPPWPLEGSPSKTFTWSINKYLTWCDSIHISSRSSIKQGV